MRNYTGKVEIILTWHTSERVGTLRGHRKHSGRGHTFHASNYNQSSAELVTRKTLNYLPIDKTENSYIIIV